MSMKFSFQPYKICPNWTSINKVMGPSISDPACQMAQRSDTQNSKIGHLGHPMAHLYTDT